MSVSCPIRELGRGPRLRRINRICCRLSRRVGGLGGRVLAGVDAVLQLRGPPAGETALAPPQAPLAGGPLAQRLPARLRAAPAALAHPPGPLAAHADHPPAAASPPAAGGAKYEHIKI
eukprot:1180590-Prorocentrum_minimum.AAC.1